MSSILDPLRGRADGRSDRRPPPSGAAAALGALVCSPPRLTLDGRAVAIGARARSCRGGGLFQAFFADAPTRPLALKLWLPGDGAAPEVEAAREVHLNALALAVGLDHPGVVRTHGGGLAGGLCWWLADWVPGPSFDRLGTAFFTPARFTEVLVAAADALDYVHARNVLHADLSPANLVWNTTAQRPVLLDFGLARGVHAARAASGIFGTPAFMAPERRSGAPATPLSDQYALAKSLARVAATSLAAPLPAGVVAALARATAPRPAARFARVVELARAVRAA